MSIPLSIVLWLPAVAGVLGLLLGGRAARGLAVLASLGTLAYAITMIADFDRGAGLQYVTDETWISELGIHYKLGVDGLNLFLIGLTALLWTAAVVWSSRQEWERERHFYFHLMLGETAVLGALMAQDLALFVAFFDLMLIPFFFLAGIWGPPGQRVPAVTKLVIYTLVGSLLMLAAAVATAVISAQQGDGHLTFVLSDLAKVHLPAGSQNWIFLCFAAAFLVKMPLFPLHGWMPDGYRAMPLPVLVVFSGVLSKVAAYGFLRIVLPLFPDASAHFQTLMLLIALFSILYGSAMAFTVTNVRLILGYSSVAQLGFIVLGIFALRDEGAQGALLQAFNHGLVVAPAFFIVGLLAARAGGSEDIRDMGGLAFRAPVLAAMFLIVALATLAMPGSSNFAGEFLILLGVFRAKVVISIVAFTGVGMAAVYMLRMFIRAMHNRTGPDVESREMSFGDGLVIVPLVAVIVGLALYPQLALDRSQKSVLRSVRAARDIASPPQPRQAQLPPPVTQTPQGGTP
ncbi:MAG: NADH-quinone oxidoreductase subunit [Thermoleophilaceae bacterium]|nr:NADH-quinone oxidoreductase subunit [Thermoleophilaceae bacterium]